MSGHGWVNPLPSGAKARCGGPGMCAVCALEAQGAKITPHLEQLAIENSRLRAEVKSLKEERGDYVVALERIRSSPPLTVRSWADRYSYCMIEAKEALDKHADKRLMH
jgi:hypothetical protein